MMHSFLLIGQSNMAGRGFIADAPALDNHGLYVFRNGRFQPMFRPVNPDRAFSGTNLSERFARLYADAYGVEVGVIPCADGGTAIRQWEKGSLLYDNAVNCARLAARTSVIAGVLWHQGETDCYGDEPKFYRARLEKLFCDLRRDAGLEGVPIVVGGLGDYLRDFTDEEVRRNYALITEITREYAKDAPLVAFADGSELPCNPDHLHFSAAGLEKFGERYFAAYKTIAKDARFAVGGTSDEARTALEAL